MKLALNLIILMIDEIEFYGDDLWWIGCVKSILKCWFYMYEVNDWIYAWNVIKLLTLMASMNWMCDQIGLVWGCSMSKTLSVFN